VSRLPPLGKWAADLVERRQMHDRQGADMDVPPVRAIVSVPSALSRRWASTLEVYE